MRVWDKEIYLGSQLDSILVEPTENFKTSFHNPATIIAITVIDESFALSGKHVKPLYKLKLFNNVTLYTFKTVPSQQYFLNT